MIDELKKQVKEIEVKQRELADKKADLLLEIAGIECPFSVGDVGVLNGYSQKGKKGVIKTIYSKYGSWYAIVQLYKLNGDLGKITTEICNEKHFIKEGVA